MVEKELWVHKTMKLSLFKLDIIYKVLVHEAVLMLQLFECLEN